MLTFAAGKTHLNAHNILFFICFLLIAHFLLTADKKEKTMNFEEQKKQFEELQNKFGQLNTLFDETMKKNNLSKEDLKIDEKSLPPEVQKAWQKVKGDIENSAKAQANASAPGTATKAGSGRKNAIRL